MEELKKEIERLKAENMKLKEDWLDVNNKLIAANNLASHREREILRLEERMRLLVKIATA